MDGTGSSGSIRDVNLCVLGALGGSFPPFPSCMPMYLVGVFLVNSETTQPRNHGGTEDTEEDEVNSRATHAALASVGSSRISRKMKRRSNSKS